MDSEDKYFYSIVGLILGLAVLGIGLTAFARADTCEGSRVDRYNSDFRAAAWRYWPHEEKRNWCELHARAMVESSGRPDVVSPAGAVGLMQIMPGTGRDLGVSVSDLYNSKKNIHAAARLAERYRAFWYSPRTAVERRRLERASYNAGPGNIIKAQKMCGMARLWRDILPCLPSVTGPHATETIDYVERHDEWLLKLQN